jgi:hypothetical protein
MRLRRVVLGADRKVHGYDFHSLRKSVTASATDAIAEEDGIGALLFDNLHGDGLFAFAADIQVSDPEDTRFDLGVVPLEVALRFKGPTELVGEQHGFADRPLDPGGCVGVVCEPGRTEEGGNTGGVPTVGDGDPVYESEPGPENTSLALAIAIAILILFVGIGLFLACTCWRKSATGVDREQIASDEESEPGGAYDLPEKEEETEEDDPIAVERSVYGGISMIYAAEPVAEVI